MDTQLTNPQQVIWRGYSEHGYASGVVDQAEPNGLFTSKNTHATIIFPTNGDGTVSPVYSESDVNCYPWPVKIVDGLVVRVKEAEPSIKLKSRASGNTTPIEPPKKKEESSTGN